MATQSNQNTGLEIALTQTDLQSANSVYIQANTWLNKYTASQAVLLEKAKLAGEKLPKDLDDELMNWQVSAKKAVKAIEEQRKPFTEKAHAFIKAFTAVENQIGSTMYGVIQQIRDASAKIHAEEAAAERAKEQALLAAKQKRIDDISSMEAQLRAGYASYLERVKRVLLDVHANVKLETYDDAITQLQTFTNVTMPIEEWDAISLVGPIELVGEVRTAEKLKACQVHFTSEIAKHANYLLELMPSRREELERGELESAQAAELARKQEEEAEAARLAASKRAEEEAAKAKQQAQVTVMVAEANREVEAPRMIESYSISVTTVDGWRAIVDYYLTNAGASVADLGKIKLDQMKAFAEKQAKATGEVIYCDGLTYEPKYKAVARATKSKAA